WPPSRPPPTNRMTSLVPDPLMPRASCQESPRPESRPQPYARDCEAPTLFRLREIFQIGRRLSLLGRHDRPIAAQVIDLRASGDPGLAFDAVVFTPFNVRQAAVIFHDLPRPRQRVIRRDNLVMKDVPLVLVDEQPLLDNALGVIGHWHAT